MPVSSLSGLYRRAMKAPITTSYTKLAPSFSSIFLLAVTCNRTKFSSSLEKIRLDA